LIVEVLNLLGFRNIQDVANEVTLFIKNLLSLFISLNLPLFSSYL